MPHEQTGFEQLCRSVLWPLTFSTVLVTQEIDARPIAEKDYSASTEPLTEVVSDTILPPLPERHSENFGLRLPIAEDIPVKVSLSIGIGSIKYGIGRADISHFAGSDTLVIDFITDGENSRKRTLLPAQVIRSTDGVMVRMNDDFESFEAKIPYGSKLVMYVWLGDNRSIERTELHISFRDPLSGDLAQIIRFEPEGKRNTPESPKLVRVTYKGDLTDRGSAETPQKTRVTKSLVVTERPVKVPE